MVLLNDLFAALPTRSWKDSASPADARHPAPVPDARLQIVLIIIAVSVVGVGFPFLPKHVTLVALLNIGIPTLRWRWGAARI